MRLKVIPVCSSTSGCSAVSWAVCSRDERFGASELCAHAIAQFRLVTSNAATAARRQAWERTPRSITYSSFPAALAFHNRNVAVDGQLRKTFGFSTGVGPLHFEPINLFSLAQAQHNARIMRRKITSPANFPRVPQLIPRLVSHFCSDGVAVFFAADQFQAEPVVLFPRMIP